MRQNYSTPSLGGECKITKLLYQKCATCDILAAMANIALIRRAPRVALRIPTAVKTCREILQGVLRYTSEVGPWAIKIVEGRDGDDTPVLGLEQDGYSGFIGIVFHAQNRRRLTSGQMPCIMIDSPPGAGVIRCDNSPIGHAAADHFLSQGFTHFAFVGAVCGSNWSTARGKAFANRLRTHGFPCRFYRHRQADDETNDQATLADWLDTLEKPTAVFVANDARALQVLNACHSADIAVPHEIAMLSCDNDELICECTIPPLSSIQMTTVEAGYAAARLLDRLMREKAGHVRPCELPPVQAITYSFKHVQLRSSSADLALPDPLAERAMTFIRLNAHTHFTMAQLAETLNVSRRLLELRFRRATGRTLHAELLRIRLERARALLKTSNKTIEDIAFTCGFASASHLCATFKAHGELSPMKLRTGKIAKSQQEQ